MSRKSAARRFTVRCGARRPPAPSRGSRSSVASASSPSPCSDGTSTSSAPVSRHSRNAPLGAATCCIVFTSSCCTRSADRRVRYGAEERSAENVAGSMTKRYRAANRMARSARRRSSRMRSSASPTARTTPATRSRWPPNGSRRSPVAGRKAIALMVKSRRARSSSRLAPNSTTACRPSVCTSRRNVVTSCATPPSSSTATVPNSMPTGTVRRRPKIAITCSGVAGVAISQSSGLPPRNASRIAPPTHHASKPASSRRRAMSSTLGVG